MAQKRSELCPQHHLGALTVSDSIFMGDGAYKAMTMWMLNRLCTAYICACKKIKSAYKMNLVTVNINVW